LIIFVLSW